MTSGAQALVTAGKKEENGLGEKGEWVVGRKLAWAGVLPRGLFSYFPFSFSFLFFSVLL
jgi:hypothetical protein